MLRNQVFSGMRSVSVSCQTLVPEEDLNYETPIGTIVLPGEQINPNQQYTSSSTCHLTPSHSGNFVLSSLLLRFSETLCG